MLPRRTIPLLRLSLYLTGMPIFLFLQAMRKVPMLAGIFNFDTIVVHAGIFVKPKIDHVRNCVSLAYANAPKG